MEFQQQQFLLYRLVVHKGRGLLWLALIVSLAILATSVGIRVSYATARDTSYVAQCLDVYFERYKPENNSFIAKSQLLRVQIIDDRTDPIYEQERCLIAETEPNNISTSELRFYQETALQYMPDAVKKTQGVQIIYITVALDKFAGRAASWWFGQEALLIDQLASQLKARNISKVSVHDWSNPRYSFEIEQYPTHGWLVRLLTNLFKAVMSISLVYVASLFCGMLAMTLNILLNALAVPVVEFLRRFGISEVSAIVSNPIAEHLQVLRGQSRHFLLDKYILLGFIAISYLMFQGVSGFIHFTVSHLFRVYEQRANEMSFVLLCVLEELSILLFRTRTSIMFCPSVVIGVYSISLFLREANEFALPQFWAYGAFWLGLALIIADALFVQADVADGSDANLHKPSYQRPRACFFPTYNLGWHWSLPPLWTSFVNVHPRDFFNEAQLCYVDGNYQLLYSQLTGLAASVAAGHNPGNVPLDEPDDIIMF